MKNKLLSLSLLFTISLSAFGTKDHLFVYVEGAKVDINNTKIELADLLKAEKLMISHADDYDSIYIQSAQFIFAPMHGEANLVRMRGPEFSSSIKSILTQKAQAGDRIIFDRIQARRNGLVYNMRPIMYTIVVNDTFSRSEERTVLNFTEYDISAQQLYVQRPASKKQHYIQGTSRHPGLDSFVTNQVILYGDLDGEILFYDAEKNLISKAVYEHGLRRKEYYFSGGEPLKIRSTMDIKGHYGYQKHYDSEGFLMAEGTVAIIDQRPLSMSIKPLGFEKSPFDTLNLESEYRPDGTWKVYNRKGEVIESFLLVINGNNRPSVKMNGTTTQSYKENSTEKKVKKLQKRKAPKKYKRLITPDF